jgi:Hydrazine synthase alpha subunit middle domain
MSAIPAIARSVPPILSSTVDYRDSTGIFQIMNIYQGQSLPGIAAGTIARLRVCELYFRPGPVVDGVGSYSHCGPGDINYGGASYHTAIATQNASWDAKWIVGETPVLSDGSAAFIVPARTPLFFQALNGKGQVVQTMRSWTTLQPGETFSCMGCHESTLNPPTPLTYVPLAIKQGPVALEPFYGPRREFNFNTEVQPILTAQCVSCHNATTSNGINLSGTLVAQSVGNPMNQSYLNLVSHGTCDNFSKYVSWFAAEDSPILQPPNRAGSCKSLLDSILTNGHHNVQVTDQELRTIRCWIDLGVPMWGRYQEGHPGSEAQLTQRQVWLDQEKTNIASFINDFPVNTIPGAHGHAPLDGVCSAPGGSWACGASCGPAALHVWFMVPARADMQIVRIQLYDTRGKLLCRILGEHEKAGFHTQDLTARQLLPGQYLVRVQTRGFEKTLPVLVVR